MPVTVRTYEQLALEDPEGNWELCGGLPRRKPGMTQPHNRTGNLLAFHLQLQLPPAEFEVSHNSPRVRTVGGSTFIPDVVVVPAALAAVFRGSLALEVYDAPLPLVAEVWSPSTGEYDVLTKIPEYQRRGDAEIWLVHPYERWLHAWRRQPDGSYSEERISGGEVRPAALPGVVIALASLFA